MIIGETTQATFNQDVHSDIPVLVDFWAPWCGPCLALAPHLETLAADYAGKLKILKLNIDEVPPDGWRHFGVRAIPTLVFYNGGKEYNRLTGPSTIRLRIMIEKWLTELGLALPSFTDKPHEGNHAQVLAITPKQWASFGGNATVKAAALMRLREHATDKRYQPSVSLAGDESFEVIVGAPASLGRLIDMLYELQSSYNDRQDGFAQASIVALVDTMPVGIDSSTIVAGTLFDLLYTSQWAVAQYFPKDALGLLARIRTLHQREQTGESIAPSEWETLQREAVLLSALEVDTDASSNLETLASSLVDGAAANSALPMVMGFVRTDYRRYPDWSETEANQTDAIRAQDSDSIREALGNCPKEKGARETWTAQLFERHKLRDTERRTEQPELWVRHDAWQKCVQDTWMDICSHVNADLVSRLREADSRCLNTR
ncbi:thioredoxin family protein [Burkholderia cepacia]|uniref:thioredoxin family protein n=1 Tax=Burkholderia cepacia TaxID=292 RepID=UPI002AB68126|nr:thioredoxin family protein [Burkholderia cepacia]